MFQNTRVFFSIRPQLIGFLLLALCTTGLLSAAPRVDAIDDATACHRAVFLDDITWLDGRLDGQGNQVYALDLNQEGLLNVEATHLGLNPGQPQLEILDTHCQPLNTAFAIHRGHRAALIPSSETYYLKVTAPGSRATSEYRLQIAFASMSQLASSQSDPTSEDEPTNPWEESTGNLQARLATGTQSGPGQEDEPTNPWEESTGNLQAQLATGTQSGPGQEDEPTNPWEESTGNLQTRLATGTQSGPGQEDEPTNPWEESTGNLQAQLATGTQNGPGQEDEPTNPWEEMVGNDSVDVLAAFADWRRAQTTSPWQSAPHRLDTALEAALCPRLNHGDDGDSLGCATEMRLGGQLQADMHHAELDDRDTYTFVLHQRAQVTIASGGDLDLRGMLYDVDGQQLAIDDEGARYGNFRLEATLEAGRYYLRVDSLDGYTGDYELLSAVAPEAWRVAANR